MLLFIGTAVIAYVLAFVAVYFRSFLSFSFLSVLFIFSVLSFYENYSNVEIAPFDFETLETNYI